MRRLVAGLLLVVLPAPQAVAAFLLACAAGTSPYACAPGTCCCAKSGRQSGETPTRKQAPVRPGRPPCHGGGAEGPAQAEMSCHHPGALEALPSVRPAVLEALAAFGPGVSVVSRPDFPEQAPRRGFPRLFSPPPPPFLGRG